jgi:CRISPR-associated protein Csb2
MLTLDVELLTGCYRAALPDGSGAEWPPHPERVFSALVQAWGDGGREDEGRRALEWLEALMPPRIEASPEHRERTAPTVYVPPNASRGNEVMMLPEHRRRQARTFRAAVPQEPAAPDGDEPTVHVRMTWDDTPDGPTMNALAGLAHRVANVGHSTSLVRLAFHAGERQADEARTFVASEDGKLPLRSTYGGRLADLERWHSTSAGKKAERPRSLDVVRYRRPAPPEIVTPASCFGDAGSWVVFEDADGGFQPDILGFAHIARRVRDALMKRGLQPAPEIISGHDGDGSPSKRPHVAIVPLANVGWDHDHATGDLLGLAVVLPRGTTPDERRAVVRAIADWVKVNEETATARAEVHVTRDRVWYLERAPRPSRASLQPERWCGVAQSWASATPVFLDRFPKSGDAREEAEILAKSCRDIRLPEPIEIEIHKHSAVQGATTSYPSRGKRALPDWSLPRDASYRDRPRRHVVLRFETKVQGPIILGAGRYHGFGLCLPLKEERA